MVGIFPRFSASKAAHRRSQSALDQREVVMPRRLEATGGVTIVDGVASAATYGIELMIEFKPVEHPTEPLDNDRPIQCPLPEPSILNDGRIWKDRVSTVQRRGDLGAREEAGRGGMKPTPPSNPTIHPSISAPEHSILKLLEESGI
nr:uncharacterized protein LOC109185174 [Ipomoea trifida]